MSITSVTGAGLSFPMTGLLVQFWNYHVAFGFAAVFTGLAVLAVSLTMPRSVRGRSGGGARLDLPGVGLISTALVCFLLAVSEGGKWGWSSSGIFLLFAAAGLLLPGWVVLELRTRNPLVDLRSMRYREVALASLAAPGLGTTTYSASALVCQLLQTPTDVGYGFGLSLLPAGLALLPMSASGQVVNRIVQLVGRRIGPGWLLAVVPATVGLNMTALAIPHDRL